MFRALSVEKWLLVLGLLLVAAALAVSEGYVKHPEVVKHVLSLLRAGVRSDMAGARRQLPPWFLPSSPSWRSGTNPQRPGEILLSLDCSLSWVNFLKLFIETNITFLRVMVANPCVSSIFTLIVIRVLFYGILIYLQNKVQGSKLRSKCKTWYLSARKASMVWF